ncbi:NAD(P)/FAD-dependent oxidoreductase [Pseudoflavonifractor phocaeensis]|uniref:NAD(P)/FAD-dependent oxidoreductase n=1 Tax=Pseudoflavonifractor phocaeensis TaxID=1870988 RepID=UPI00195E0D6E|nr:FAD-dependent oxidoreductase [Pseudoflavonifractor phocaeensis]MBM6937707.1 NAD(P)/FAD-dependent oxidoreductase [Pseudoflavonifractor phocaeensis]
MDYVIIGNGAAAVGCVEGIRALDQTGSITVVSAEPYPVYGRPLISYLLEGKTTEEKMLRYRPENWYKKNGVALLSGRTAVSVDSAAHQVTLDNGAVLPYHKLCFATGSRPFVPPMEGLETVEHQTSFMTLDDARRLSRILGDQKDKRVLIIGAGLIGLKCAEGILDRCASLTVVDMAERILPNVMLPHPAALIQKRMEDRGVAFLLGDSIARFEGNHAVLKSGKAVDFDVLVVAVGVRPNTELAAQAGCAVDRGIFIDDHCAAGPDLWAAGDCTRSHDISNGSDRILAILPNAYLQGETAGLNMAGGSRAFTKAVPMNASGFFGLHVVSAGSYDGQRYLEEDPETGSYKLLVTRDDRLVGFILLGDVERAGIYTSLIREQTPLSSIDFDLIREKPQLMAFSRSERAKKLGGVQR